jgi:signal transduction histidine kinase/ligand-binding sensor domain-containing protein/CheY-like chemotaxis protein
MAMRSPYRSALLRVLALVLAWACVQQVHAAPRFRHLTMEDGLSNNEVYDVVQDRKGYIWLATADGLDRYDGYSFTVFRHDPTNPASLSGNYVRSLAVDSAGRVWVGTIPDGLNLYDPVSGGFKHFRHVSGDATSIISDSIVSLAVAPNGALLIGTYDSGLDVLDPATGEFRHFPANAGPNSPSDNRINRIFVDSLGHTWLATANGLDDFSLAGRSTIRYFKTAGPDHNNNILAVAEDSQHRLWTATHTGPYLLRPGGHELERAFAQPNGGLADATVIYVTVDSRQNLWYSSVTAGLYLVHAGTGTVRHYMKYSQDPDALASNTVFRTFEDRAGFIWIATQSGVSILDPNLVDIYSLKPSTIRGADPDVSDKIPALKEFHGRLLLGVAGGIDQFMLDSSDDGLRDSRNEFAKLDMTKYGPVRAIAETADGRILVSTQTGYLVLVDANGRILQNWLPNVNLVEQHAANRLLVTAGQDVYLATFGNGLQVFNLRSERTRRIAGALRTQLSGTDIVEDLWQASPKTIWAGTFRGLFRVDTDTGVSELLPMTPGNTEPVVQGLYEDEHHTLWVATYNGLWRIRLDPDGHPLSQPESIPALSHTQVLAIEQDDAGRLWLATANSLLRFDPQDDEILVFGRDQGSPVPDYYSYGHTLTSNGWLWFAGGQGAVGFLPRNLNPNRHPPDVVVSSVTTYREGKPLNMPLQDGQALTLGYKDAINVFDVLAMDFGAPQANTYSYRLVGFQPEWTPPSPSHLITFTNLNPGRYRLEVRATNNWGTWSATPATLDLVVLPPWWRTWWAYTIYLMIIIGSAIAYVYSLKRKIVREKGISASLREANEIKSNFVEKLESQVQEATLELRETLQGVNLKNAELEIAQRRATEGEQVKSQFLANMSHELRTPLTGVLGYTKLLTSTNLTSEQKDYVGTIRVSSESLLAIINDTLDLSRLEAGKLLIDEVDFDLLELIESTLEMLAPIAYQKRLELIRIVPPDAPLHLRGDPLRMRQVLTNLLSNAIKFTESGAVCLEVRILEQTERDANIVFRVTDTGIGIPEGEISQLFNAYHRGRISTRHHVEGTGLGLTICKKLLDLMGGQIGVESRVGTGTTFHFQLKFRLQKHVAPRQQLPKRLSILLYDKHPMSNAAWKASLTRLGAEVREVTELESLVALQAEAAVLSLSERELMHLGELRQKFSPALPPMLILAPRIDRQTLKDLSESLYHRVLSKIAREKTVYLELQSLVQHAIHVPEPDNESKPKPTEMAPTADAPLVLVADDNRINRRLLVTMLNQSGFRTAEAGNGIELLDLAARGGWQAALLDIHMPGMDGIETATRLRMIYGESTPPIIAMSADVLPGGQDGPQQGLMDDFLMKPFNEHQLVDLLRQHLERFRRRQQAAG